MSESFQPEQETAGPVGEPPHASWLVELGVAARARQVPKGRSLRAWGPRRAAARARREYIEQLFAGTAPGEPGAVPSEQPVLEEAVSLEAAVSLEETVSLDEAVAQRVDGPPPVEAEPEAAEVEDEDEPAAAEIVPPLLARIGAYTAKPGSLSAS